MSTDRDVNFTESMDFLKLSITPNSNSVGSDLQSEFETLREPSEASNPALKEEELTAGAMGEGLGHQGNFRPLLLFIPLRLGQDSFNMEYAIALKVIYTYRVHVMIYISRVV